MGTDEYTCPNGCDLRGEPISQVALDEGYYAPGVTHYSRKVGIDGAYQGIYDGIVAWACPDCGACWPVERFAHHPLVLRMLRGGGGQA